MHTLPPAMIPLLRPVAPLFAKRVRSYAQILLAGTILALAECTVVATLRVLCGAKPARPARPLGGFSRVGQRRGESESPRVRREPFAEMRCYVA